MHKGKIKGHITDPLGTPLHIATLVHEDPLKKLAFFRQIRANLLYNVVVINSMRSLTSYFWDSVSSKAFLKLIKIMYTRQAFRK